MLYSWGIVCRGQWSTCVHYVSYSQRRVEVGRALWRSSRLVQRMANYSRLLSAVSNWGLNLCVDGDPTASCGCIFKWPQSRFQGAKSTCISWIFIAAPPPTSFTACFQVAISSLAVGSPNQPIWADLSPHCCHCSGRVCSCFPQKEVDGSRQMPASTSQLLQWNFQPLQVKEPLCH